MGRKGGKQGNQVAVDASPIIVLAKMGRLKLLKAVYDEVLIGPAVKWEVIDRGRARKAAEVRLVEGGFREGWIREVSLSSAEKKFAGEILRSGGLGKGEAETIALGRLRNLLVVLDDKEARTVAEALNVEHVGTAGLLLEAFIRGALSYVALEEAVIELAGVMWISPEVVAEILARDFVCETLSNISPTLF